MNLFKSLFGTKKENSEEKQQAQIDHDFDVLKFDGVKALKGGMWEYAIKCFKHALELKDDLEIHDYLSQALLQNNELLPAYDELRKLADAQPQNIEIFIRMARVAYMMEDYGAMFDACEKAMLIDKDNVQVLYLYAQACIGQGDMVNAIAMLTKAISEKSDFGDAYLLRGETLLKMHDIEGARQDADYLMQHVKDNEDVLLLKARVEEASGKHDEALKTYDKVIEVNPFCAAAFKERGAIRFAQGDKQGAEEDMKSLLELDPSQGEQVSGDFSAEGKENIQQKVEQSYKQNNPFGF